MKLHINLTPVDREGDWAKTMLCVRDSFEGYLHNRLKLEGDELGDLTGSLFGALFEDINRFSQSMLTFTFDNTDIKDKKIEKNIEVITLDTRLDDVLSKVRTSLEERLVDISTSPRSKEILEMLASLGEEGRAGLVGQLVNITHGHISPMLDGFFRDVTAELISIRFRLSPIPVVVDTGKERVMSMSALLKDMPKDE